MTMMDPRLSGLDAMRAAAQRFVTVGLIAHVPIIAGAAVATGNDPLLFGGVAAGLAALAIVLGGATPLAAAPTTAFSRALSAVALAGQVAVLVGGVAGSPWQLDAHMYFFAMLAVLISLLDARAWLLAAAAVALHHLGLNAVVPELLYPGGSDLGRVLLHALVLAVMTVAAMAIIARVTALFAEAEQAAAAAAAAARARAEAAEETRRQADERAAAERREVAERLNAEIGAVVAAAGGGDFSARVTARFDDPTLQALADQTNRLVETAAAGIDAAKTTLNAIAAGDLDARMHGSFQGAFAELQRNLNATGDTLADLMRATRDGAAKVLLKAREIQADSEVLAGEAECQASSLEQTAATMEQMSATIRANAEHAAGATELAGQAQERARRGQDIVAQAVTAMGEIEASSSKITDIIGVIDGIAFQTNLLALNAAVEAARAGEAGKGFAVVASEVRSLSQRSAEAARDIKALIVESSEKVADGSRHVGAAGSSLEEILQSVAQVAQTVDEISSASREQSSGISEISAAISKMDESTQKNAALAERSASAARELTAAASAMSGGEETAEAPLPGGAAERAADADWMAVAAPAPEDVAPPPPAPASTRAATGGDPDDWAHF